MLVAMVGHPRCGAGFLRPGSVPMEMPVPPLLGLWVIQPSPRRGRERPPARVVHRRVQHRRHHEPVHQDRQAQAGEIAAIVLTPQGLTLRWLQRLPGCLVVFLQTCKALVEESPGAGAALLSPS